VVLDALSSEQVALPAPQRAALEKTLVAMRAEHVARAEAARRAADRLSELAPPGTSVVRLPFVHRSEPRAIVLELADAWAEAGMA
jgi:hypothetical protein